MFHSAVDQAPGVPLHTGRQATGELRGRKGLMILRSDVTLLTVAASCNLPGTFSMSVSCSRSLASLSIGRASNDKSQSQLPKLCLRLASSMVMILEKRSRCANQRTTTQCVCVCVFSQAFILHSPPSYKRQGHQRSCRSCPAHPSPQQQIPGLEPPFHTHPETTGRKMNTDGPL